jgi:hypothetical protein
VFLGGSAGAVLRELLILVIPRLADNFPLDILAKQLVPRLRRRTLRPTSCEPIVPLSRIVGSQGCGFEAWSRLQAVSTLPKSREHERVTVFHLGIVADAEIAAGKPA